MRAHQNAYTIGNTYTNYYNANSKTLNDSFVSLFDTVPWVAPLYLNAATGQNFATWEEYYGPTEDRLDNFTTTVSEFTTCLSALLISDSKQQYDLSNVSFDENNVYEVVYGYANRTASNPNPPYAPEDIIIVS